MKKHYLSYLIILLFAITANAQDYHNDWINYDQTYYKFKVAEDGLYRITYEQLTDLGLNEAAEGYHLIHKGNEVPIYIPNESMEEGDFIEFYGQANDGELDQLLFKSPAHQNTKDWSLFTDSAAYYLFWDDSVTPLRVESMENEIIEGATPLSHFFHTTTHLANNAFCSGKPVQIGGTNNYFADFDEGEGFISTLILGGNDLDFNLSTPSANLYGGPATIKARFVGRNNDFFFYPDHHIQISINGKRCNDVNYEGYTSKEIEFEMPISHIKEETTLNFKSMQDIANDDRNSLAYTSITYPRLFEFGGDSFFQFAIQNDTASYLSISDFNGGENAVLYDLDNQWRVEATFDGSDYQIQLPLGSSSGDERNLVFANTNENKILNVDHISAVEFTDFSAIAAQGNFILIYHPSLMGEELDNYIAYRSSEEGGGHSLSVVSIEELYDQFAWGIQFHPLSIRHFINYTMDVWEENPDFLLLMGKSVDYKNERFLPPSSSSKNLVPSFGSPPSDFMLTTSSNASYEPQLAVGRVPARVPAHIQNYLDKLIAYEAWQEADCNTADRDWMKKTVNLIAGYNTNETTYFQSYLDTYIETLEDTLWGGEFLGTISQSSSSIIPQPEFTELYNEGLGLITYMGHPTSDGEVYWNFDIHEPAYYQNDGKYPIINANSCFSGNIHSFGDPVMAEEFTLTPNKGSIAYIAVVNFGFPAYLDIFNTNFYNRACKVDYGESVGQQVQSAISDMIEEEQSYSQSSIKRTIQSLILAGDPAVGLYTFDRPDYEIEEASIEFIPNAPSISVDSFMVNVKVKNYGKAIGGDMTIQLYRSYPGGVSQTITKQVKACNNNCTYSLFIPNNVDLGPLGTNNLIVTIDPNNLLEEDCEENNEISITFEMNEAECEEDLPAITNLLEAYCLEDIDNSFIFNPWGGNLTINGEAATTFNAYELGPGTHTISYSVETDCGLAERYYYTEVLEERDKGEIIGPESACIASTDSFEWFGHNPESLTFEWVFGENASMSSASGPGPHHVSFEEVGEQIILLHLSDDDCFEETIAYPFNVDITPPAMTISCLETDGTSVTIDWEDDLASNYFKISVNGNPPFLIYSVVGQYTIKNLQPLTAYSFNVQAVGLSALPKACDDGPVSNTIDCETTACLPIEIDLSGIDNYYCYTEDTIELDALPVGGYFAGNGMADSTAFSPAVAGLGHHLLTYQYTDTSTNCRYNTLLSAVVNFYPDVNVMGNDSMCEGGISTLEATVGLYSYNWSHTDDTTALVAINEDGFYEVWGYDEYGCFDYDSMSVSYGDWLPPVVELGNDTSIVEGSPLVLDASVEDALSYNWSSGDTTAMINILEQGVYSVDIVDINGCVANDEIFVEITEIPEPKDTIDTSIQENITEGWSVFPTMVEQDINILFHKMWITAHIRLVNVDGRVIFAEEFKSPLSKVSLNMGHLPSGSYFLVVDDGERSATHQVVKF